MKKYLFLLVLLCFIPLIVSGCSQNSINSVYDIKIIYDEINHTADCEEVIKYFNNSTYDLNSLCFHLYPNAFNDEKLVVTPALYEKAYPNGISYGGVDILNVEGNEIKEYCVDGQLLTVYFKTPILKHQQIQIKIDFVLTLPNIKHRFGYGDNTINFGNFYPIVCVCENGEFMTQGYTSFGDPFYSDCSDYNVEITYDKNLVLASTGIQEKNVLQNDLITTTIKAENVRDFCFVLSNDFLVLEYQNKDLLIKYYYMLDSQPENSLQTVIDCINTFDELFGEYPYKTYSVVEADFVFGGMEYPNLVLVSNDISNRQDYNYVIAHETAHQWWYGVVGNDEYNSPWIDESLTEFSTALFFKNNPQYALDFGNIIKNCDNDYFDFVRIYKKVYEKVDTSMERCILDFKTEPEYVNCIYVKGLLMFADISAEMGDNRLISALQFYYKKYKFQNVSKEDLISCILRYSNKNIKGKIECWLKGNEVLV